MSNNKKVNFVAECDECGHTIVSEDFDWECYTHHMEDYEDRYAAALGIKYNGDGTWCYGDKIGDLDDSLRDFILKRIKELVGA